MSSDTKQDLPKELDQFYTDPNYADAFYTVISNTVDLANADILLEPSAGTGNFYSLMDSDKRVGLDLDPKHSGVIKTNFFDWTPATAQTVYTIGNPPFGKNSSLAVKFFNHAAEFSDVIAFVVPRTFRKASIVNRLNNQFHCVYDQTVPDNSFIYKNKPYNVWCCAQIWVKKSVARDKIQTLKLADFEDFFEIVDPAQADFAVQRVGGKAGLIRTNDFKNYSKESHYFIKQHHPRVLEVFQELDFDKVKYNTAGNPSVSPSEMLELWKASAESKGITYTFGNRLFEG